MKTRECYEKHPANCYHSTTAPEYDTPAPRYVTDAERADWAALQERSRGYSVSDVRTDRAFATIAALLDGIQAMQLASTPKRQAETRESLCALAAQVRGKA